MRVITFKASPKFIFGAILAVVGIVVIVLTFIGNHPASSANASFSNIAEDTQTERSNFLKSFGWEFAEKYTQKDVIIPSEFNDVYSNYNEIQKKQGFDLSDYKGKTVKLYTYSITNYKNQENSGCIFANILVFDNKIIGGDICSTALDGFMHGFEYEENNAKTW